MNNPYPSMFPPMDQPPPAPDHAIGIVPLANHILLAKLLNMFTIEHTFDCSVITLVDEGQGDLGAALDLPEGVYRLRPETGADD